MNSRADDKAMGKRKQITRAALEQTIAEAVRASRPECKDFVGVVVERVSPDKSGDPNWVVKGVRYGKANRDLCGEALSNCVAERQLEFELNDSAA